MARIFNESKLLIATKNNGKVKEIESLLQDLDIDILSLAGFDVEDAVEDGKSFEENAVIKAKFYGKYSNLPALADDSGLVIPSLNGQPGIYSARWAGDNKDFNVAMDRVKRELYKAKGFEYEINDPAYFVCVLSIYWPEDGHVESFEGRINGHLRFPATGKKGFGYDPIFVPEGYSITMAEIEPSVKNNISHRANAFKILLEECFKTNTEKLAAVK